MLQIGQGNSALWDEVRALFSEAHLRRRRRRRWVSGLAVAVLAASVAMGALAWVNHPPGHAGAAGRGPGGALEVRGTGAEAVWVDDSSRLHVGVVGAGGLLNDRVVGEANAASEPLVAAGRRVYWVDPAGAYVPALGHWSQVVMMLNLRTGRIAAAGAGQTVFLSADRRYLLMSQTPTSLTQTPVGGGRPRLLNLPRGWYLPGGDGNADPVEGQGLDTANGILVQSRESPGVGAMRIASLEPADSSGHDDRPGQGRDRRLHPAGCQAQLARVAARRLPAAFEPAAWQLPDRDHKHGQWRRHDRAQPVSRRVRNRRGVLT